ncbi:DltD domain-containing protein [Phlyctema vagabunda]|uniref:DltD domain-containing protein n=1 Tax=Phlyctema vagabunda TaxID=108571 RepID=A0ABR4P9U3_9HELO
MAPASLPYHEDCSFPTLDGNILRGHLYPATERGPGVIITPGYSCVKEMFVHEVAEHFQLLGITALAYDPRSFGESDGIPRCEADPAKQAEDYSDAFTYMASLPIVDPRRIAFWGMSFSGMVSLCASAVDKRAKAVIAVCPLVPSVFECNPKLLPKVLAKAMKDRESQIRGNPPFYLPVLEENGENAAGFGTGADKNAYGLLIDSKKVAPRHENRTTIQTYSRMLRWQPLGLLKYVNPTPVMFVVPELDLMSPAQEQLDIFENLKGPKRLHIAPGKGHMEVMSGPEFVSLMKLEFDFLMDVFNGTFA